MKGENNPSFIHGHNCRGKRTREYEIWAGIRKRCLNPKDKLFPYYGGRGINLCESWRESFVNFYSDMGDAPSPKHSIDRINNDGDYCSENCRWATKQEQSRNRRSNIMVSYKEKEYCLKDFCLNHGLPYKNVWRRIKQYGWSVEKSTGIKGVTLG